MASKIILGLVVWFAASIPIGVWIGGILNEAHKAYPLADR